MRLHSTARRRRRVPQLNTTATADISFMLLIFFLVTTSMDTDKGLRRQLPPKETRKELPPSDVDRATVLTITITPDNRLALGDSAATDATLRHALARHITSLGSRHIIEIVASGDADYDTYFHLQDIIAQTYRTVREQEASRLYHRAFAHCTPAQQQALRQRYPQRVSEQFTAAQAGKEAPHAP